MQWLAVCVLHVPMHAVAIAVCVLHVLNSTYFYCVKTHNSSVPLNSTVDPPLSSGVVLRGVHNDHNIE